MSDSTLNYYNQNADTFVKNTVYVDFKETQDKFLSFLKRGDRVLDFGCGSGRDTKYFLEKGMEVDALDGSAELCRFASTYTGITVKQCLFEEFTEMEKYAGIGACSSILHLSKDSLKCVMRCMVDALVPGGIIYTSFKYGEFEGERNGRYFTDFTLESFRKFVKDIGDIKLKESWITGDVRSGRGEEKWLNVVLEKTNF